MTQLNSMLEKIKSLFSRSKYEPLIELEGEITSKGYNGCTVLVVLKGNHGKERKLYYPLPLRGGVTFGDKIRIKFEIHHASSEQ